MQPELIVYTGGTFDLPHSGHVRLFARCAQLGSLVVSLNTDEFVESYKGKAPVMSFDERKEILEAFRDVSAVIANSGGADSREAIESVMPDYVAIGSDWARRDYHRQMNFTQDWLDDRGIALVYFPYTFGISTTRLRASL